MAYPSARFVPDKRADAARSHLLRDAATRVNEYALARGVNYSVVVTTVMVLVVVVMVVVVVIVLLVVVRGTLEIIILPSHGYLTGYITRRSRAPWYTRTHIHNRGRSKSPA